jgi:uncharacterized protein
MSYELYEAIVEGEIETAKQLIADGEDIHHVTANDKWSYLHQAADTEYTPPESFQYLIDQGLDVNAIDSYGNTPLIYAVRQRNVDGIRLLLDNGASKLLEHENNDAVDALRMGFDRMPLDYGVFETLLKSGAQPDKKNRNGTTARELLHVLGGVDPSIYELFSEY